MPKRPDRSSELVRNAGAFSAFLQDSPRSVARDRRLAPSLRKASRINGRHAMIGERSRPKQNSRVFRPGHQNSQAPHQLREA
jgi:hypothetical protein